VVVKDVPAGATVVGIPGRIVVARDDADSQKRRAMAEKIGFDAYGQHAGQMPDPVSQALDRILDHLHAVDDRLQALDQRRAVSEKPETITDQAAATKLSAKDQGRRD
jgi:serine O-acetyltransferase